MSKRQDTLNHLKKQSFRKAWNALSLYTSYHLSKAMGRPILKGLPMSVSFEPTTACNLRCPECPSGLRSFTRETGNLKSDLFEQFVLGNKQYLSYLNFYFQGEPYINPQFLDMVAFAGKHNIYSSTSTNAHFLDDANAKRTIESGLDRLIISIDGTSQDVYEQYRKGGKLSKVIEGTKNVVKWKKALKSSTPHVVFQFLVVKPNEHQTEEVKKLGAELGVDEVKFKTAQIYDFENGNELIPENDKYSRYKKGMDGKYRIKNPLDDQCWKMWHSCVITWDGKVVPCCFDKDAHHVLGNISRDALTDVWKSADYQRFRSAILKGRSEIDICKNCSEGTRVWA